MVSFSNDSPGSKGFVYFPHEDLKESQNRREEEQQEQNISNELLDKLLRTIGREVLREKIPNLQELEQTLQDILTVHDSNQENHNQKQAEKSKCEDYRSTKSGPCPTTHNKTDLSRKDI